MIATVVDDNGIIINRSIVIDTPDENNIKSNGLNIPNINCPLFVFAGIK